ncbi:hypothetical protein LAZ67_1006441 [Cordylochernes scorpioides]|uniref:Transposase Tc1-like domain-containing protein n=1 Tax=Cordylochernes scorpioides TaxID=51811 RepID=A0ABY6JYL6_9ARAC|nr:hypothetical protein LAZ67_1006441 [Cordylochernes scorpioides]
MPGHRKRRQFKQTDAFTRGMVIGLKRAARVDRRILRQAVAAPQATCTAILQHVQDTLDHSISTRTISRRLVANGLHSCRPLRRLPLTPPNRRQRLEWCRARSTWMTEWHRVVFSDESRFCLSSDSRRVRVWRRRGERSNPAAIVERLTVRQRGIMVWGAIAYDSRSPLLCIQGTMTAQRYVDDVLRPVTLPYLQGVPNALYQQDNARPHTTRISQQALQDVQMLPWPQYSPDLSQSSTSGTSLDAVCMPCHSRVQKTNCRKWTAGPADDGEHLSDDRANGAAGPVAVGQRLLLYAEAQAAVRIDGAGRTPLFFLLNGAKIIMQFDFTLTHVPEPRLVTCTRWWEATLDRSNVYRWYKKFSEGDEERAGRPSTSTTDEKNNEVEKMILANRRITVREVAEDLNISIGSCHSIFVNDLGMRRVAAKFVPKLLNCDQKQLRMNIANKMLDSVRDDPKNAPESHDW